MVEDTHPQDVAAPLFLEQVAKDELLMPNMDESETVVDVIGVTVEGKSEGYQEASTDM
jgi:hypothetical protein